ncbi:MAG: M20 family metallopeptidase [Terriglobia bacterium]
MISWLQELIQTDTPSGHKPELDRLAANFASRFREDGAQVRVVEQPEQGNHIWVRFGPAESAQKPLLLLGHMDTVWEAGESLRRPPRIEDGKIFGPGAFDMRGGLTLLLALSRYLSLHPNLLQRPVTLLLNSDEETGSHSSRALIEAEARQSEAVLVLEPCLPGGAAKTSRKGVGTFTLAVTGVAAHAGVNPTAGASAIEEIAHQVLEISRLGDPIKGTTLNVGVIRGGTHSNVVADRAEIEVDFRVRTIAEGQRLMQRVNALQAVNPRVRLQVSGGLSRPPLERTEKVIQLFQRARKLAAELGFQLDEGETGGGSDGCFTAALGIPTLDGLGPDGDGPHALHEHVRLSSLVPKAALLASLVTQL